MNTSNLLIDPSCLGDVFQLTDVRPIIYADGKRLDAPTGYTYEVCIRALKNDKLAVKIAGAQLMEAPSTMQDVYVQFDGLRVRPYVTRDARLALTATASSIKAVPRNTGTSTAETEAPAGKEEKQRR